MLSGVLLKKWRLVDAVGITLQSEWLIFEMWYQYRGDTRVIIDDLAFRESDSRVKYLVKVGQLELLAFDFDNVVRAQCLGAPKCLYLDAGHGKRVTRWL